MALALSGDRRAERPFAPAMVTSSVLHLCVLAVALAIVPGSLRQAAPERVRTTPREPIAVTHIVFLPSPTAAGAGGGGGGNRQPEPIRRAEAPGTDRATVRVAAPVTPSPTVFDAPALPALLLDATPLSAGVIDRVGLPSGGVPFGTSTGSGSGGGVGTGTGTGVGSGTGPGLGEGTGGGTGGGVYRPGGAVSAPELLSQVRPAYTVDALDRRLQGSVVLELVVTAAGTPSRIRVARSLDPGLDGSAMAAVSQWTFKPGRLRGVPVDVLVTIILDFTIH
jgi:periplasmic protein TonB